MSDYNDLIDSIFESAYYQLSDILPSEWAEENRFMTSDVSPREGMFSYSNSPYTKAIVDCLSPDHPARIISVIKGSQLGFSTSVIENGIGWIISQQPGNTLFLVGHDDLVKDAVKKTEIMIQSSGIENLIRSASNRNNKTGNTDTKKEFVGGEIRFGIANHKVLRNISMRYGFIDDYEAMKGNSKESGDTSDMIINRFKAFKDTMKLFFISTPEQKETSNIEPMYEKGNQCKWFIPCPCCGEKITLEWEIDSEKRIGEKAGIVWSLDEDLKIIYESIGYNCYKCDGFFTDANKNEFISKGEFIPTAEPITPGHYSFHLSALYAPSYMFGWKEYVEMFLQANPPGGQRNEAKHMTFVNQVLGQTYQMEGSSNSADVLQKNIRPYEVGIIPESLSISDGNGKIVMLTLGSDMNGTVFDQTKGFKDDARLDWEIVAWSESGASYSIDHGSIGSFVPAHLRTDYYNQMDRKIYSYQRGAVNNIWDELDLIRAKIFKTDTGRALKILSCSVDTAPYTQHSYPYIDSVDGFVFGVKGDKLQGSGLFMDADYQPFKPALERGNLWILNVNHLKDITSTNMNLNWDQRISDKQPSGFMNFPTPSNGKYLMSNYFSHFEAEHKVVDEKTNRFVWSKKQSNSQNHLFDCRLYAYAAREILSDIVMKDDKIKKGTWNDFVNLMLGK